MMAVTAVAAMSMSAAVAPVTPMSAAVSAVLVPVTVWFRIEARNRDPQIGDEAWKPTGVSILHDRT
jgi:hypothetical protein